VLFSSIFISASTLCLEVGVCGLLSVVLLLLLLLLLSLDLGFVFCFWSSSSGLFSPWSSLSICFEFWLFVFVSGQVGLWS